MKLMNLITLFVFLFHTHVWAAKPIPFANPELINKVVNHYNSLNNKEKYGILNKWIDTLPKEEKSYFKNKDFTQVNFPELNHSDGSILFEIDKKKIKIDSIHKEFESIKVNGVVLFLTPDKLQSSLEKLDLMFQGNRTSLMEIVIPVAHAGVITSMAVSAVISALLAIIILIYQASVDQSERMKTMLKVCHEIKDTIQGIDQLNQQDLDQVQNKLKTIISGLNQKSFFNVCQVTTSLGCSVSLDLRSCLQDVEHDLKAKSKGAVNSSHTKKERLNKHHKKSHHSPGSAQHQ